MDLGGFRRYAVYYAPERGSPLSRFGAAWLGWEPEAGVPVKPPAVSGLPLPSGELAAEPRRYGFHGTLKAPFRLAGGCTVEALSRALAEIAEGEAPFMLPPMRIAALGQFLAVVPVAPSARLDALAARCVTGLDGFRSPLSAEERARRIAGLDTRRTELLDRWGYPHVLEAFRFHLTLTGPLDAAVRDATAAALEPVLAPILAQGQTFSEICLFGEPESEPFRLLRRYRLGEAMDGSTRDNLFKLLI